jgi:hypothetical protein
MSTNITTAYKSGDGIILQPTVVSTTNNAGTSIAVTLPRVTRILAIHAFTTVTGLFDIGDTNGSKIQFQVGASGTADIYMGETGIKCEGTVSVATPQAGSVTLILG